MAGRLLSYFLLTAAALHVLCMVPPLLSEERTFTAVHEAAGPETLAKQQLHWLARRAKHAVEGAMPAFGAWLGLHTGQRKKQVPGQGPGDQVGVDVGHGAEAAGQASPHAATQGFTGELMIEPMVAMFLALTVAVVGSSIVWLVLGRLQKAADVPAPRRRASLSGATGTDGNVREGPIVPTRLAE